MRVEDYSIVTIFGLRTMTPPQRHKLVSLQQWAVQNGAEVFEYFKFYLGIFIYLLNNEK